MNRSCEYCKWREERVNLTGTIQWCGAYSQDTKLDGYCINFQEKRTAHK